MNEKKIHISIDILRPQGFQIKWLYNLIQLSHAFLIKLIFKKQKISWWRGKRTIIQWAPIFFRYCTDYTLHFHPSRKRRRMNSRQRERQSFLYRRDSCLFIVGGEGASEERDTGHYLVTFIAPVHPASQPYKSTNHYYPSSPGLGWEASQGRGTVNFQNKR